MAGQHAQHWDLLRDAVIEAVNARGMCAGEVAHLAGLPELEVQDIAARCTCPSCSADKRWLDAPLSKEEQEALRAAAEGPTEDWV